MAEYVVITSDTNVLSIKVQLMSIHYFAQSDFLKNWISITWRQPIYQCMDILWRL